CMPIQIYHTPIHGELHTQFVAALQQRVCVVNVNCVAKVEYCVLQHFQALPNNQPSWRFVSTLGTQMQCVRDARLLVLQRNNYLNVVKRGGCGEETYGGEHLMQAFVFSRDAQLSVNMF